MRHIRHKSMISLISENLYFTKRNFSPGIFLLALTIAVLITADIVVTIAALLTVNDRIFLLEIILIMSLLFFIVFFWKETGGDFFSFINIILIGYLMMFAIPALINLYVPGAYTKPNYWDTNSAEHSLLLLITALYSLVIGYKIAIRKNVGITLPFSIRPFVRRIHVALFICMIMWLAYYFVKSFIIGIDVWKLLGYHTRDNYILQTHRTGFFAILDFFNRGTLYIFLLCLILPRDKQVKKGIILGANLFIFFYILNAIISGTFMTAKSTIFTVLFIYVCFRHYTRRKIEIRKLALVVVICIVVVVIFNYQRTGLEWRQQHNRISDIIKEAPRMYAQSFEDFEVFSATVYRFPQFQPHYYGRRLFEEIVYLPIPRFFWKGKPVEYGSRGILYDIEPWFFKAGYSAGVHSQFYADFGLAGIIIGFVIFGWLIGWVYNTFRLNCHNRGVIILYTLIIANTWLYFKGGFPWLNLVIMVYIPFYILLWYLYPRTMVNIEVKKYEPT